MAQSDHDKLRKAEFREEARGIVLDDRERRKYGHKLDTGGVIARALEKAYQRGHKEAKEGLPEIPAQDCHKFIHWILIPSRSRDPFYFICLYLLGNTFPFKQLNGGLETYVEGPFKEKRRWRLTNWDTGEGSRELIWGHQTIKSLVTRGLLEHDTETRLKLTTKGIATWQLALKSVDFNCNELW